MAGNGGCDGLKIVKIGQSAAEFLVLDNTKLMCIILPEKGSTTIG
jgi:hypothetical protein